MYNVNVNSAMCILSSSLLKILTKLQCEDWIPLVIFLLKLCHFLLFNVLIYNMDIV